ncbi:cysteine synthase family protein [Sesbania bispinosa]|nr:cysteine synthase family protein [Sesbania bispinosa]
MRLNTNLPEIQIYSVLEVMRPINMVKNKIGVAVVAEPTNHSPTDTEIVV